MKRDPKAIYNLFETVSLGAPEKAVGFVLWRVVHRYMREVDRALVDLDLTHLQFTTLAIVAWLGRSGEPVTQSEITKLGDIQPMQVSYMLKALESKRLVARTRNPSDVRAKHVKITSAGLGLLRRAMPLVIGVQQRLFGDDGKADGKLLRMLLQIDNAQVE